MPIHRTSETLDKIPLLYTDGFADPDGPILESTVRGDKSTEYEMPQRQSLYFGEIWTPAPSKRPLEFAIPVATRFPPFASKITGQPPKADLYVGGEGCGSSVSVALEKMRSVTFLEWHLPGVGHGNSNRLLLNQSPTHQNLSSACRLRPSIRKPPSWVRPLGIQNGITLWRKRCRRCCYRIGFRAMYGKSVRASMS